MDRLAREAPELAISTEAVLRVSLPEKLSFYVPEESLMAGKLIRTLNPEEEELLRKKEEFASMQAALGDRELEFAELRRQLAQFEAVYCREVGVLYAELDDWNAKIAELQAKLNPSPEFTDRANSAREQARQTYESAHRDTPKVEPSPSPELKRLYRDVAKRAHPDLAKDTEDGQRRNKLMADANRA